MYGRTFRGVDRIWLDGYGLPHCMVWGFWRIRYRAMAFVASILVGVLNKFHCQRRTKPRSKRKPVNELGGCHLLGRRRILGY